MGKFRDWIELLILPLLTAAVIVLADMNKNITQLNVQVGIILSEREADKEFRKDFETRIRILESKIK